MPGVAHCGKHRALNAARNGKHGATYMDRERLFKRQHGLCPVCREPVTLWDNVDHDHKTKAIRGLLHGACNRLIGLIEQLGKQSTRRAFRYLRRNLHA
jgi:hypothetical protein